MSMDRVSMLHRLQSVEAYEIDSRVFDLLKNDVTHISGGDHRRGSTVHETASVWRVRAENNKNTEYQLFGAAELLRSFSKLAQQRQVEQVSLRDDHFISILFFDWSTGDFLGYVLSKRREEDSRMRGQHQAELAATMKVA